MPGGRRLGSNKLQMLFYTKNLIRTTFPVCFETVAKKCIIINSTFANGFNAEKKHLFATSKMAQEHFSCYYQYQAQN